MDIAILILVIVFYFYTEHNLRALLKNQKKIAKILEILAEQDKLKDGTK